MNCQRKKVDNMECRSKHFLEKPNTLAFWHGFRVCKLCHSELKSIQKGNREYQNHIKLSNKHCIKCGVIVSRENRTGHCKNCLRNKFNKKESDL